MKRRKAVNFLTVTLFIGVLFTFMIYAGTGALLNSMDDGEDTGGFNKIFYSENVFTNMSRYIDYKVFGHIEGGDYIIGKDDWIFEAVDSQNGYERLLDYVGGCPFDEKELERITGIISKRAELYESGGVEYMMIVIPDSTAVCSDKLPSYLGNRSDATRLSQLTASLAGIEVDEFINPTDIMISDSGDMPMYNNTENSLNAYGAYCIYNTVVARFMSDTGMEVERLRRDDVDFYTRLTEGRHIARNAGIESFVKNSTVSLSDDMPNNYTVEPSSTGTLKTRRNDAEENSTEYKVIVECTNSWDRIQLTPYFSNTFDTVIYQDRLVSDHFAATSDGVTLVVQVVRESELAGIFS